MYKLNYLPTHGTLTVYPFRPFEFDLSPLYYRRTSTPLQWHPGLFSILTQTTRVLARTNDNIYALNCSSYSSPLKNNILHCPPFSTSFSLLHYDNSYLPWYQNFFRRWVLFWTCFDWQLGRCYCRSPSSD